jgi:hypothetical protein
MANLQVAQNPLRDMIAVTAVVVEQPANIT